MGAYQPAAEHLRRAWEQAPDRDEVRELLAGALFMAQQYADAAGHYEALLGKDPQNQAARIGLAQCRFALGDPGEAQRQLDAVLAENPHIAPALQARGKMALQLGHPEEAERWLREARAVDPHDHLTTYQLIICLKHLGKQEEAEKLSREVHRMELDMERVQALMTEDSRPRARTPEKCHELGALLLRNGRVSEGLYWLYKALELDPGHRATHLALARYWEKVGNKDRAAGHWEALERLGSAE
jgi:tetratricopeptide (TPR) repeat protein